jgi:anti-anti-sigma factor
MFRRQAVGSPEDELVYASAQLAMRCERDGDVHLIALIGELDIDGAPAFENELKRAERSDAGEIVVDLSGLDFISSDGLKALIHAQSRSRDNRDRLRLLPGTDQVQKTFETAGLVSRLPFRDDRELRLDVQSRPAHARVVLARPVRHWRR